MADRLEALVDAGGIVGWRYHTTADEVEEYDVSGRLILITSREGFTQTLSYDLTVAEGGDDLPETLDTVTGPFGARSLHFNYGGDGKISQMTLMPGGEVYRFEYNARLLTKVLYPDDNDNPADPASYDDNPSRQYAYDESAYLTDSPVTGSPAPASLTGIVDESGTRHASWWYSGDRVVRSQLAPDDLVGVNRVDFLYNTDGTRTITDAFGTARLYGFEIIHGVAKIGSITGGPCEACGSSDQSVTYDANGYKDDVTDFNGNVTDYDHNARGLEEQRIEAVATPSQRTVQTDWHADFRVPIERRTLDANGTLVAKATMTYNARGQVLTATQSDPAIGATRTTTTAYCEQADVDAPGSACPFLGLLKSVDGPRTDVSDVTTYAFYPDTDATGCDSGGTCHHRGDRSKITNALGQVTEFTRYDGAGRVVQIKDANGVLTDLEYHARGWLTASKVRGPNAAVESDDQITLIEYFPTGLVKKVTQPDGAFAAFSYDAAQRLVAIEDNLGNRIDYTLDALGNRIKEDVKDSGGVLRRTLSRTYNQLNRLASLTGGEGQMSGFSYDANGNRAEITDPRNNVTTRSFDALDRLVSTEDPSTGITGYAFDARDNLVAVTDPRNLTTLYGHDGLDNRIDQDSPDTGVTAYTHDAAGNVLTQTDARGVTVSYGYDALNRLVSIAYPDSTLNVAFGYDNCPNGVGRLCTMTDGSGSTAYQYDTRGNVTGRTITVGTITGSIGYAYDRANRLVQITYPSGRTVDYTRNVLGQVTEVTTTSADGLSTEVLASNLSYAPFGPMETMTYGNGIVLTRNHDLDYRLTDQVAGSVQNLSFGYDANDNVTALTDGLDASRSQSFSYDALDRLTNATGGYGSLTWSYDALGNRQTATGPGTSESYGYATDSNRLIQFSNGSPSTISYDANGNITGDGYFGFSYGDHNRMTEARIQGSPVGSYTYNGLGQRVKKDNGAVTHFVYDEAGRLVGEYDEMGFTLRETVWLNGAPLAVFADDTAHFVHADHLGTPRAITDGTGTVLWRWDPAPFGNTAPDQDPDGNGLNAGYNPRFPGQYFDVETRLHYNYFRDYIPTFGRYVQSDPIGLAGDINTYRYVRSNPIASVDPKGLITWTGTSTALSVVYGGGATRLTFALTSECINNRRARVLVIAGGFAVSVGITVSGGGGGDIEFEDKLSHIDPFVFEGEAKFVSVGLTLGGVPPKRVRDVPKRIRNPYEGLSIQFGAFRLGGATSTDFGQMRGLDASISGGAGISRVDNVKWECCTE